jgi:hypothetical protein
MGRNNKDFTSGLGNRITDRHLYHEEDSGAEVRKYELYTAAGKHPVASLEYAVHPDAPRQVHIEYLKSHDEGKGHAQTLLHHVYQTYPENVSWGTIVHPASRHLLEKMDSIYGTTSFGTDDY